ncbi:hypothetical protein BC938DRAFT_471282 [Jimgerdemannia flammicorona]|uniref:Uncharacterized protein n=1 Tax=Jimgerdemannia flammicorona TaxID=994334 RepID=A0A433Q8I3_9FUNG|nr:hypothetical protein BC938DRAFT_471282 [Jimgerdemannia flammicorona]
MSKRTECALLLSSEIPGDLSTASSTHTRTCPISIRAHPAKGMDDWKSMDSTNHAIHILKVIAYTNLPIKTMHVCLPFTDIFAVC